MIQRVSNFKICTRRFTPGFDQKERSCFVTPSEKDSLVPLPSSFSQPSHLVCTTHTTNRFRKSEVVVYIHNVRTLHSCSHPHRSHFQSRLMKISTQHRFTLQPCSLYSHSEASSTTSLVSSCESIDSASSHSSIPSLVFSPPTPELDFEDNTDSEGVRTPPLCEDEFDGACAPPSTPRLVEVSPLEAGLYVSHSLL